MVVWHDFCLNIKEMRDMIITALILLLSLFGFSQEWHYRRQLNFPRTGLSCQVVNGRIYAIGGKTERQVLGICEEYDPVRDTWVVKRPMPTPRYGAVSGVWENKIYVIGGDTSPFFSSPTNVIEVYDPERDTWEKINSFLPTPRSGIGGCALGPYIFIMGGSKRGEHVTDTVEVYDILGNSWLIKKSMITPRMHFAAVAERRIYALGGLYQGPISLCEGYNESLDFWYPIRRLPCARFLTAGCAYEGKIFLIGGITGQGKPSNKVKFYIPEMDTWVEYPPINRARAGLGACTLNGEIYAIGGDSMGVPLGITEMTQPSGIGEEIKMVKGKRLITFWKGEKKFPLEKGEEMLNILGKKIFGERLKRGVYFLYRKGERVKRKIVIY